MITGVRMYYMELPDFLHCDGDGEIRLKGHRIRLIDVAARYEEGHSAETILLDYYPTLKLSIVHKVIGFYLENQSEVKALIEHNTAEMQRLAAQPQTTPTYEQLRKRMDALGRAAS